MSPDQKIPDQDVDSDVIIDEVIKNGFTLSDINLNTDHLISLISSKITSVLRDSTIVVPFIGGAASGKTTLAHFIADKLIASGTKADVISTDDFLIGDRAFRREHLEGKDPMRKYDFGFMNEAIRDIRQLSGNQIVKIPAYDEETGIAITAGEESYSHSVGKVDVLLVEGDFPCIDDPDFNIYLHLPDKMRLLNRLDRDLVSRGESSRQSIVDNFNLRHKAQHLPITLSAARNADLLIRAHMGANVLKYDVFKRR